MTNIFHFADDTTFSHSSWIPFKYIGHTQAPKKEIKVVYNVVFL